jgi:S-adenosylmethionine:tRNA ribosyltransferase-isomerase
MNPEIISIGDYNYFLPEDRIAKYPLASRDASKILVYNKGETEQDVYRNIAHYLPSNSIIVFNNTKVVEARLLFQKPSGGIIEIFCLEPSAEYADISTAMLQKEKVLWKCLIGGASKWKHGTLLQKKIERDSNVLTLTASINSRDADTFIIELSWTPVTYAFAEVLHLAGAMPLPPYIKREAEQLDEERYQTIYAKEPGSVAAPTAGLHFTEAVFDQLALKNIEKLYLTLHVGAGTFKPVKTETMAEHEMHAESFEVDNILLNKLNSGKQITAVGTTSARTLETLYWLGVKTILNPKIELHELNLDQWEAYSLPQDISKEVALNSLFTWMQMNRIEKLFAKTKLLIVPGYKLRMINILVTNFHQPQSTLLLLVAAIAGRGWKKLYEYALANQFRFLSYGDGCLIYADD